MALIYTHSISLSAIMRFILFIIIIFFFFALTSKLGGKFPLKKMRRKKINKEYSMRTKKANVMNGRFAIKSRGFWSAYGNEPTTT